MSELDVSTSEPSAAAGAAPTGAEFGALLEGFRRRLEDELTRWLARKHGEITAEAAEVAELSARLDPYVLRGGKRLRPALIYFAYRGCGGESDEAVLPAALAVELLHTYLLIHDDIMDRAETRRGGPSAHLAFRDDHRARGWRGSAEHHGESTAILLGDLAHCYAEELFSAARSDDPRWPEIRRVFSAMCQEVIAGQYLEMTAAQRSDLTEEKLLRVLRMKSGRYSVERPIQLGALLARAPRPLYARLSELGLVLGEAFQLQDDLLGMFGDTATTGKPVGGDLAEGKYTLLVHATLERAPAAAAAAVRAALGNAAVTAAEVERVRAIIRSSGAERKVKAMVEERVETARRILAGIELREEGRAFFEGLVGYLREREQ